MDIVSSPKVGRSLPKTILLVVRSFGLWEAYTQTFPKWDNFFYHDMFMALHDSVPSFMNYRRVLDLLEFKNQASQCFAGNQRCPGVWNFSFPFLAWDLSMHPRTQIWFFDQFICTGACACSSNLNYANKMHWKLSKYIKMYKRTSKNHKNSHNTPVVLCWHEKKN